MTTEEAVTRTLDMRHGYLGGFPAIPGWVVLRLVKLGFRAILSASLEPVALVRGEQHGFRLVEVSVLAPTMSYLAYYRKATITGVGIKPLSWERLVTKVKRLKGPHKYSRWLTREKL